MRLQPAPLCAGLRHRHTLELLFAVSRRMRRVGPRERGTSEWISNGKWRPPLYICMLCTLPLGRHEKEMLFDGILSGKVHIVINVGAFVCWFINRLNNTLTASASAADQMLAPALTWTAPSAGTPRHPRHHPSSQVDSARPLALIFTSTSLVWNIFFVCSCFFMSISILILNGKKIFRKKRKIINFLFCSCSIGKEKVSPQICVPKYERFGLVGSSIFSIDKIFFKKWFFGKIRWRSFFKNFPRDFCHDDFKIWKIWAFGTENSNEFIFWKKMLKGKNNYVLLSALMNVETCLPWILALFDSKLEWLIF